MSGTGLPSWSVRSAAGRPAELRDVFFPAVHYSSSSHRPLLSTGNVAVVIEK